ncbi:hypothetical protein BR93DRAFT_420717 [Coniochaeta sp. PMI_546]|nr:hypothetical protein BR93DRAFT_420717 [Coniochaeta sp. PMI_546]
MFTSDLFPAKRATADEPQAPTNGFERIVSYKALVHVLTAAYRLRPKYRQVYVGRGEDLVGGSGFRLHPQGDWFSLVLRLHPRHVGLRGLLCTNTVTTILVLDTDTFGHHPADLRVWRLVSSGHSRCPSLAPLPVLTQSASEHDLPRPVPFSQASGILTPSSPWHKGCCL